MNNKNPLTPDILKCYMYKKHDFHPWVDKPDGSPRYHICPGSFKVITHKTPKHGQSTAPCCKKLVFELPRTDKITEDSALVTCRGNIL